MNQMLLNNMKSFKRLGQRLGTDSSGFVVSLDYILLTTIVVIGMIVGVVSFRDQVVQEFGDIAEAMKSLDQSYSYSITIPDLENPDNDPIVIEFVNFNEDDPQNDPPPPGYPAATGESGGEGSGQPPAGISFQEPTGEK